MKFCTRCKQNKIETDFYTTKLPPKGDSTWCLQCKREDRKIYNKKNSDFLKIKGKEMRLNFPWLYSLNGAKQRCNNPKNKRFNRYGKRGIKCLITKEEVKKLWFRDKAYLMNKPTIDRENNNKNYTYKNCRFIEHKENSCKDKRKIVHQYTLNNNFIKSWKSQSEAERETGITHISCCVSNKRKTAGGFIWRGEKI